ncbi:MAG TPA: Rieske 2Fe-2S domain-containing protein, partial [Ktedonobacteraceae bacterium]|nr:Rieske 2Fe-2S domain-containing protein [Ktedonobacteraceae bacterium]
MLSKEQNELMCRVGPGTVMGAALKQYWVPAVRAARLIADGAPVRIRLFGEEYVAFRATDGRVGFFDEGCPHRGVSLGLANNGDCALTCLYHGWKIDVSGKVVDVPSEPAERKSFGNKVRVNHYPVREAGGLIWVWLGKGEAPPAFPEFRFTQLPVDHVDVRGAVTHCNWVQGLEGVWDSSHVGLLHQSWLQGLSGNISSTLSDSSPRFDIRIQPYGMQSAALRQVGEGRQYVRVT